MSVLLQQNGRIYFAFVSCRNTPYSVKQVLFWQWIALWEQNIQNVSIVSSLLLVQGRRKSWHINSSGFSGLMCPSGCDIARGASCLLCIAGYKAEVVCIPFFEKLSSLDLITQGASYHFEGMSLLRCQSHWVLRENTDKGQAALEIIGIACWRL